MCWSFATGISINFTPMKE